MSTTTRPEPLPQTIKDLPDPKEVALRFLICAGCNDTISAPLHICKDGHPVCEDCCTGDLTFCPYPMPPHFYRACQKDFIHIPMAIYKYIHTNSIFYCRNKGNGCPMLMKGKCVKEHLAACLYGKLPRCIVSHCNLEGCTLTDYQLHLNMDHNSDIIVNNNAALRFLFDSSVREKHPTRAPYMFYFYGATFVLVIHEYEERVAIWISLIHGPSTQRYKVMFLVPVKKLQDDDDKVCKKDGQSDTSDDGKVTEIEGETPDKDGKGSAATNNTEKAEDKIVDGKTVENGGENSSVENKGQEDKIVYHEVHPLAMPTEDIIDLCECLDMPMWAVENKHLVTDGDNRLIWPIEVHIECIQCNYDDADITIGIDDSDNNEEPTKE